MEDSPLIQAAHDYAEKIHARQYRLNGSPYIGHVERVAAQLAVQSQDPIDIACALLHDVIEDGPPQVSAEVLEKFGQEVHNTVEALSRREGETYVDYIQRLRQHPRACRIKIADLNDNLNDDGSEKHPGLQQRYHRALLVLQSDGT